MNSVIEKEKKLILALTKLKNLNLKNPEIKKNIENLDEQKNQLQIEKQELEEKYKNAIANHNSNVDNCFPDSGFDLFLPTEFSPEIKTEKIDYKIKAAMFKTMESCKVETANQNAITFNNRDPMPYYLYP